MQVQGLVPTGSGAWVLHEQLRQGLGDYRLYPYSRWWELFPVAMPMFARGRPDLLHTTLDYGALLRRPGVPLVTTAHNYLLDVAMRRYASPLQRLHYRTDLRLFTRLGLRHSDRVVAVSRYVADCLQRDMGYEGHIDVIHNGVDTGMFVPLPRSSGTRFRVLFCGNTSRRKRADLLVPIANALGDGFEILYTAGLSGGTALSGDLQPNSARLVSLGRVSHERMPEVYRQADLLLMPSVREGFGLCVAEAMACALPVVAASGSAMGELVLQGQGGKLCSPETPDGFVTAIREIAADPAQAARMGEFNRSRVEMLFTLPRMVDAYRRLFEEVLDQ